jgi:predicted transcriptional regulator
MTASADGSRRGPAHRPERIDTLFRVLSDQRRRIVLRCLEGGSRSITELARRVAAEEGTASGRSAPNASLLHVRTALEHQHLPKLVHTGLVQWDREADDVSLAPGATVVQPLLEFATRAEERPAGRRPAGDTPR